MTLKERSKVATERVVEAIVSASKEPDKVELVMSNMEYKNQLFSDWDKYFNNLFSDALSTTTK